MGMSKLAGFNWVLHAIYFPLIVTENPAGDLSSRYAEQGLARYKRLGTIGFGNDPLQAVDLCHGRPLF